MLFEESSIGIHERCRDVVHRVAGKAEHNFPGFRRQAQIVTRHKLLQRSQQIHRNSGSTTARALESRSSDVRDLSDNSLSTFAADEVTLCSCDTEGCNKISFD